MSLLDYLTYAGIIATAIAMIFVVRWRRRSHRQFVQDTVETEMCPHLRIAYDALRARGHIVVRAGQKGPDYPFEVHLAPAFDPQALADEFKLAEPAFVSERNVLACREDLVELHPVAE